MKIVIDARMGIGTGVGRYTFNLLEQLQTLDSDNQYVVLLTRKDFDKWHPKQPNFTKKLADYSFGGWQEQVLLPVLLYKLHPDLVHFTAFNAPFAYFGKYVVMIHDFTLVHFRNTHSGQISSIVYGIKYWGMRALTRHVILLAKHIVTPTEFVRNELLQRYKHSILPAKPERVTTTLESADAMTGPSQPKPAFVNDRPFLFYAGNSYPHKNLNTLVDAFAILQSSQPELVLVLVGQEDYFYLKLRDRVKQLGLEGSVLMPGYVTEKELGGLYQHASAFVFPSLSEGFGLPPLEAMAYGTPVISSNASCMPEVLGDAAAYFDPTDPADMAAKIQALLSNKKELARLREAGPKRVKQFSWKRMAEQTLELYHKVLGD